MPPGEQSDQAPVAVDPPMGSDPPKRYAAFISYSHSAEGAFAPALQEGLQRLAKPWRRQRALEVFRDQTGLAVSAGLWPSICAALDGSSWLVLLASPQAAQSAWVGKEIERWIATKGSQTILPVVTDGTWVWDERAGDFDREASTAVHPALHGVFAAEPRHLDMTWAKQETHLTLRNPRFRDAVAELAAPMHGLTKDELEGDDVRQQRRTIRLARGTVAGLAVLTLAASSAAVVAVNTAEQAGVQRRRAEAQKNLALSRQLVAQSEQLWSADPLTARRLALTAYRLAPTDDARYSMLAAMTLSGRAVLNGHTDYVLAVAFSPDGRTLATGGNDKTIRLWEVATRRPIGEPLIGHTAEVNAVAFSPDGRILATSGADYTVRLWDVATRRPIGEPLTGHTETVWSVAFSPDGHIVASAAGDNTVRLWDVTTRRPIGNPMSVFSVWVGSVAFSPDGRMLASANWDNTARIWDLTAFSNPFKTLCDAGGSLPSAEWNRYLPGEPYQQLCPGVS